MKIKKFLSLTVAAVMAVSAMSMSAFAADDEQDTNALEEQSVVLSANDENTEIQPFSVGNDGIMPITNVLTASLSGIGSFSRTFIISNSEPYFKVWVGNESARTDNPLTYTVTLKKSNRVVDSFTVAPGYLWNGNLYNNSNYVIYNDTQEFGSGTYEVTVSNNGTAQLTGSISVRRESIPISD